MGSITIPVAYLLSDAARSPPISCQIINNKNFMLSSTVTQCNFPVISDISKTIEYIISSYPCRISNAFFCLLTVR